MLFRVERVPPDELRPNRIEQVRIDAGSYAGDSLIRADLEDRPAADRESHAAALVPRRFERADLAGQAQVQQIDLSDLRASDPLLRGGRERAGG